MSILAAGEEPSPAAQRITHLLCRFSQTVYSARKLSTKPPVALVQKRG